MSSREWKLAFLGRRLKHAEESTWEAKKVSLCDGRPTCARRLRYVGRYTGQSKICIVTRMETDEQRTYSCQATCLVGSQIPTNQNFCGKTWIDSFQKFWTKSLSVWCGCRSCLSDLPRAIEETIDRLHQTTIWFAKSDRKIDRRCRRTVVNYNRLFIRFMNRPITVLNIWPCKIQTDWHSRYCENIHPANDASFSLLAQKITQLFSQPSLCHRCDQRHQCMSLLHDVSISSMWKRPEKNIGIFSSHRLQYNLWHYAFF